jgi:hypothetical protein
MTEQTLTYSKEQMIEINNETNTDNTTLDTSKIVVKKPRGRPKSNRTPEQIKQQQKESSKKYYLKNKEELVKKNTDRKIQSRIEKGHYYGKIGRPCKDSIPLTSRQIVV